MKSDKSMFYLFVNGLFQVLYENTLSTTIISTQKNFSSQYKLNPSVVSENKKFCFLHPLRAKLCFNRQNHSLFFFFLFFPIIHQYIHRLIDFLDLINSSISLIRLELVQSFLQYNIVL